MLSASFIRYLIIVYYIFFFVKNIGKNALPFQPSLERIDHFTCGLLEMRQTIRPTSAMHTA